MSCDDAGSKTQHQKCVSKKCVGVGESNLCGWRTPANGKTEWKKFGTQGLYIDVNTSWCSFPAGSLPQYVVSLQNANRSPFFGLFRGSVSLLRYSRDSFRAVVWLTTMAGAGHGALLGFARKYTHAFIYAYTHAFIYAYIRSHIHTFMHSYTHTVHYCIHILTQVSTGGG
jgi:hypothetical protein